MAEWVVDQYGASGAWACALAPSRTQVQASQQAGRCSVGTGTGAPGISRCRRRPYGGGAMGALATRSTCPCASMRAWASDHERTHSIPRPHQWRQEGEEREKISRLKCGEAPAASRGRRKPNLSPRPLPERAAHHLGRTAMSCPVLPVPSPFRRRCQSP